ncbi:hypothetical protein HanRHA438_Chr16g0770471 [Helianthus annuus]|nr:hypothetical protein HanRHA438_Chr16g0770471 [Helianthus annuus]
MKHNTQGSPINTNVLIRMKVSVTSTMFTNLTCKLSKCVCVVRTECSQLYLSVCLSMCICLNSTHCMGIYTQPMMSGPKDPIDGPKDQLSITKHSKDQQGPRKITFRDLSFETYLSMRSKDPHYPSISYPHYPSISYPSTQNIFQHFTNCCSSQTGGWLTWSTYNTNQDIVYIVTEYRQSTDTSAPTFPNSTFLTN